jgi:hypothetical protein
MTVHQCPRCELRFRAMPEVVAHLIDDHHVEATTIERHLSGMTAGVRPRRRTPDPTRVVHTDPHLDELP